MAEVDLLVHISYVILIISFLMRDILWLRTLNIVSVLVEVAYFYLQPTPRSSSPLRLRRVWVWS